MSESRIGLVCSLVRTETGALRVVLDDVSADVSSPASWAHESLVAFKDYPGGVAEIESLDDKELADFGYYILARLLSSKEYRK